tara:strand:- start:352 stop:1464 length:1113 start_codon:yes stop_codon:yes gene_type:complete
MPKYDLSKKIINREISRRNMIKGLGAAGVITTTMPMIAKRAMAAQQVGLFTWGGYDDDGLYQGYIDKHGGPPEYTTFGDAEEGLQKLRAGYVTDVIHPCYSDPPRWVRAGVIQPIDTSRLPSWGQLFPELTEMGTVNFDGKQWMAPVDWGDTSLIYNPDKVDWMSAGNESLGLLFDDRMEGKLAILDSAADSWYLVAIYHGIDVTRMEHVTKDQVDSVYEALRKMRKNVKIFTTDTATMEQALMDEEVWCALGWNESSWNTGFPMMSPSEGTLTWSCGLVIHKDAPNLDLAYDLIESAISAETSEYLLNEWGYGHSNKSGYETIDAAGLAERGLAPDPIAHLQNGNFSNNPSDEITDYIEMQWAEYTAGG